MDIVEINNTITELETGPTTFDSCQKLASLYIVRDNLHKDQVINEYDDILPSYRAYCNSKELYQRGEVPESFMKTSLQSLSNEIYEFLHILYISADTQLEQNAFRDAITKLNI